MKILMLGWEFAPFLSGGLGRACEKISYELADLGHEIDFVVPHGSSRAPRQGLRLIGLNQESAPYRVALNPYFSPYLVWQAEKDDLNPYVGDLAAAVKSYTKTVTRLFGNHDCDVIHAHDWLTFPAARFLARKLGVPFIAHFHSLESDRNHAGPDPRISEIERRAVAEADTVLAVSRFTRESLTRLYGLEAGKGRIAYNGTNSFRPAARLVAIRGGRPTVLFIGRITAQKGVQYLCPIARAVLRLNPDARFVVAGEGDLESDLRAEISEAGLSRSFELVGQLGDESVARAYRDADVVVMPSVSEPFGLVAAEAVEHGVPVVLSAKSGVSEIMPRAFRADPTDPVRFGQLVSLLLQHREIAEEVTRRSREDLAPFTWRKTAASIEGAYRQAVRA